MGAFQTSMDCILISTHENKQQRVPPPLTHNS